ncbi:uncharacterized protein LOC132204493 isoform X2 [Neocloeon triangulifer]|uniref:uncharacterized protein LOC132204493 isoform X2 n=1 Tax=Neocloeon triangulifer TaxID=2078957 RepID=UPI00286EFB6C|nr:uncharacterized protein LOC132204493 isoform X2 [Neocloeon triangulifer]
MVISSLKKIFLSIIISLILVEWTASRVAGFCDSTILTNGNDERLQCHVKKGRENYNTGDVRECKCNGGDCNELPHASFVCSADSNWYFEDNNSTSEYWGVECKDEKSCPRCFIPKSDFSNCYKVKGFSNYFACVCKHNQREYTMTCQHDGHLHIWSPVAHTKCEKPKVTKNNFLKETTSTFTTGKVNFLKETTSTFTTGKVNFLKETTSTFTTGKVENPSSTHASNMVDNNQSANSDVNQANCNWNTILTALSSAVIFLAVMLGTFESEGRTRISK